MLTGGTDVHLVLVDLRDAVELDGQQAEDRLAAVDITVNRNAVPFRPRPPMITRACESTPALAASRLLPTTTSAPRADLVAALTATNDDQLGSRCAQVQRLAARYPLYPELHRT